MMLTMTSASDQSTLNELSRERYRCRGSGVVPRPESNAAGP